MYRYHLVGAHAGKTITLGGHEFVDGVFTFGANKEGVMPSPQEATRKSNLLGKCYQAYLEGPELDAAKARIEKAGAANAGELDVAKREDEEQANRPPVGTKPEPKADKPADAEPEQPAPAAPEPEVTPPAPEQPTTERKGAVRTALTKLDATNDDHWTGQGLPSVEAVRELSGNKDVSRQDIQALAPKLNREEAKKIAAEQTDPLD